MKLSLVVMAQGNNQGKVIPIAGPHFLIGRDPECHLRPSSPAISKQHCALDIREDKVHVRDFGSTNGTFVNGEQVAGERELKAGDNLKVGPLEFTVRIEALAPAPAAAKPPAPVAKPAPSAKPAPKPVPADTVTAGATAPGGAAPAAGEPDADHLAAMFLMEDGPAGKSDTAEASAVPDGTTVMDVPALPGGDKAKEKAKNNADTSSAAASILSKYMRRPRT